MCYVGGMVENTTRETTVHEFEPQHMRIYLDLFFFKGTNYLVPDAATGTK